MKPSRSNQSKPTADVGRRGFLRGFGTLLALPYLESVGGLMGRPSERILDAPPKRLMVLYSPNGMHMQDWRPTAAGKGFELPYLMEPFAPYRKHLTVISGLAQNHARPGKDGPGDHARAAAVFLTGVHAVKTGGQISVGPSADQIAAAQLGDATRFRSMVLGCERGGNSGQCDSGYSCAYSHNISWQNKSTPAGKETDPRQLFDRLFRGTNSEEATAAATERRKKRRSVLDYVRDEAKRLEKTASASDQIKLDEFQSGIREMERRLEFVEKDHVAEVGDELRPQRKPKDFGAYVRLMLDLQVLAFQTDRTRIATFMIANEGSNRSYPQIGIREGHHEISHHRNEAAKQQSVRAINRYHTELVAHLLKRLDETKDGNRSLLDQIMLLYGSGIGDGNRHNHDKLPIALFGGGGGALNPGAHLVMEKETPLNNLLLTLIHRLGCQPTPFGDATDLLEMV